MQKTITLSRKGTEFLLEKNGITVISGSGEMISPNKIKVTNDDSSVIIETRYIICAQGSKPAVFPPFSETEGIWTSDDIFSMEQLPSSLLIIGGGVIGVEFATFFSTLGVKTFIVELMDHILPLEDSDAADEAKKSLEKQKVKIYEKFKVDNVVKTDQGYKSVIINKEEPSQVSEIETEKVLLSVGRSPNVTEDMKKIGLFIEKGIKTNEYCQTSIPNIYAVGDIRAKIMLAHVASQEGITAVNHIMGKNIPMDWSAVPSIVFCNPEIASCGIKEKEMDQNIHEKYIFPLTANGRAKTMEEKSGFVKIIVNKKDHIIAGMTIVSPYATELIMEGIISLKRKIPIEEFSMIMHPHPTLSESILGAFEAAEGLAIHI